jgi:hypothetical protein
MTIQTATLEKELFKAYLLLVISTPKSRERQGFSDCCNSSFYPVCPKAEGTQP